MEFFGILAWPISWILNALNTLIGSYGLAIIILTVIIRFLLFPLTMKQMRSQQEMQRLQPRIKEIEKKYKGNKQAIQEATMALYKQENVSMTGGCLPMIIQLFVIMGLYQAIYRPLYFLYRFSNEQISALRAAYGVSESANEATIAVMMNQDPSLMAGIVDNYQSFQFIDFNFLGINLALTPGAPNFTNFSSFFSSADILWIIPIFALITGIFSAYMSKKMMPNVDDKDNPMAAQTAKMSKMMMWVMPIMSLYFAFILPTGVGLYWGVANLIAGAQQFLTKKLLKPLPPLEPDGIMEKRPKKKRPQNPDSTGERPAGQGKRPQGQRPQGQRPSGQKPQGKRPSGQASLSSGEQNKNAPNQKKPVRQPGQRVKTEESEKNIDTNVNKNSKGQHAAGQRPPGQRPPGQRPAQRKLGQRPADKPILPKSDEKTSITENDAQIDKGGEVTDDKS